MDGGSEEEVGEEAIITARGAIQEREGIREHGECQAACASTPSGNSGGRQAS